MLRILVIRMMSIVSPVRILYLILYRNKWNQAPWFKYALPTLKMLRSGCTLHREYIRYRMLEGVRYEPKMSILTQCFVRT